MQADFRRSEGILGSRSGSSNLGCPAAKPFAQEQRQAPLAPAASSLPAPFGAIWRQRYRERAGKRQLNRMHEAMGIALLLTRGDTCLGRWDASLMLDPPQPCCRDRGGLAGGALHLPAAEGAPRLHPLRTAAGHLPGHLQRLVHAARLQHQVLILLADAPAAGCVLCCAQCMAVKWAAALNTLPPCVLLPGRLWDAETGACQELMRGHEGPIWSMHFDGGTQRIASCDDEGSVRLWDLQSHR